MRYVIAAVLLASAPAHAGRCPVEIVRAPDGVRDVVARWLEHEPRCMALEVRIVETTGGLYLVGRDDQGRTYDRVVPDAESAGALIASWAADDGSAPVMSYDFHVDTDLPPIAPPGQVDVVAPVSAVARAPRHVSLEVVQGADRVGVSDVMTVRVGATRGLRAEVDLGSRGPWVIGLAFAKVGTTRLISSGTPGSADYTDDMLLVSGTTSAIYIGRPFRRGRFELDSSLGVGLAISSYTRIASSWTTMLAGGKTTAIAQASLTASYDLFSHLAIAAGPLATYYGNEFDSMHPVDLVVHGGLRWTL